MFLSYEYIKYLGFDKETEEYKYQYKIIDSDFEVETLSVFSVKKVEDVAPQDAAAVQAIVSSSEVIDVYEKRNLNVPANLALLFQFMHTDYDYKISSIIKWNKKYILNYLKYADEVEKYMVWI